MRAAVAPVNGHAEEVGAGDIARALAAVVESVDSSGSNVRHARGVATFAVQIARALGVDGEGLRTIELGALLHDVGKLCVPRSILAKRGPLTPKEWRIMRAHAEAGERILAPLLALAQRASGVRPSDVLTIVRSHHERWDGSGYPDGLAGREIARGARVVAVADAFQAMIEPRPYRRALRWREALDELSSHAGTQFDAECVDAMLAAMSQRPRLRTLVTPLAARRTALASRVSQALSA